MINCAPDVVTVAVSRVDGGVTVMRVVVTEYVPYEGQRAVHRHYDVTPEYVDVLIAQYVDSGCWQDGHLPTGWRFVPNDFQDDTVDRQFRDAWCDEGATKPSVRMSVAKEIHRDRIRRARADKMADLDIQALRAIEDDDKRAQAEITGKKRKLRDATDDPRIDAAMTPEELKAVWPLDD